MKTKRNLVVMSISQAYCLLLTVSLHSFLANIFSYFLVSIFFRIKQIFIIFGQLICYSSKFILLRRNIYKTMGGKSKESKNRCRSQFTSF